MSFQTEAKVIKNVEVAKKYYKILLSCPKISWSAEPGQFVEVKVSARDEPLLRRPFSIHRVKGQDIEILYAVVGTGTEILSRKESGEYLDIIGPLGNGFDYRTPEHHNSKTSLLVLGGIGVAPLVFLAEKLKGQKTLVLIGAKTKAGILCEKAFKELGCAVKISTDDGSRGFHGKVTELLQHVLKPSTYNLALTIYACGPHPMLKEVSKISQKYNIPAQVSLEEHMACGIGACLGCVVKTSQGYQRVCKEGPVFKAHEIIWE